MNLILLTDAKASMAFCKVEDNQGFAISELGTGWIQLGDAHKSATKGTTIDVPNDLKPEFYDKADTKTGQVWNRIRFVDK